MTLLTHPDILTLLSPVLSGPAFSFIFFSGDKSLVSRLGEGGANLGEEEGPGAWARGEVDGAGLGLPGSEFKLDKGTFG